MTWLSATFSSSPRRAFAIRRARRLAPVEANNRQAADTATPNSAPPISMIVAYGIPCHFGSA